MRLAHVEFVAGAAVVHSNRRHGLGAVTMKIADKHDTCCLAITQVCSATPPIGYSPESKQQRSIQLPSQRLTTNHRSDALADKHSQVDNDLVQDTYEPQPAGRDVRSG